jgi:hypothetical protein
MVSIERPVMWLVNEIRPRALKRGQGLSRREIPLA